MFLAALRVALRLSRSVFPYLAPVIPSSRHIYSSHLRLFFLVIFFLFAPRDSLARHGTSSAPPTRGRQLTLADAGSHPAPFDVDPGHSVDVAAACDPRCWTRCRRMTTTTLRVEDVRDRKRRSTSAGEGQTDCVLGLAGRTTALSSTCSSKARSTRARPACAATGSATANTPIDRFFTSTRKAGRCRNARTVAPCESLVRHTCAASAETRLTPRPTVASSRRRTGSGQPAAAATAADAPAP